MSETKIVIDEMPSIESTKKETPIVEEATITKSADTLKSEKEAAELIGGLFSFLKGGDFQDKVESISNETKIPRKIIAKNFADKVLGTIADIFGLCIDTIADTLTTLINILARVLISGTELIMRVAKRLIAIITLNKTCKVN